LRISDITTLYDSEDYGIWLGEGTGYQSCTILKKEDLEKLALNKIGKLEELLGEIAPKLKHNLGKMD
jgi:hypothetical protein